MLLVRPPPKVDEHLLNYLLRLSIVNGFKNTIQLLRCIDMKLINNRIPPKKVALGDLALDLLSKEIDLKKEQLSSTLFRKLDDNCYQFKQLIITASSVDFSKPTFCPKCFCEELSQPFQHLLLSVTHCEKHKCALIDFDPSNGKRLTWSTANLMLIMQEAASMVKEEAIPAVTSNINQLLISPTERLLIGEHQVDLSNYLLLLHFFVHYHQRTLTNNGKRELQLSINQRAALFNTANDYLDMWPKGFYSLLNHFVLNPMSQRGETGIRHYFRDLYDEIYLGVKRDIFAYRLLMDAFEDYLENEFSQSSFTNKLTRIEAPLHMNATYICEKSAAKLIDTPVSHLKIYVSAGLLTQQKNRGFLKTTVDTFITKSKAFVTLKEATNLLVIGKHQVLQLVNAGLLNFIIRPDSKFRDWLFDKKDLQALISKIKLRVTNSKALSSTLKTSSFKALTFNGNCISKIIESILSNKTTVIYIEDPTNLLSLQQFHPCFDSTFQAKGYVSPLQASKELGVNINAIYDFVKRGFLTIEKQQVSRTSRPVKLIPQHSIDYFNKTYTLRKNLNKRELKNYILISGPKSNGGIVNLYAKLNL